MLARYVPGDIEYIFDDPVLPLSRRHQVYNKTDNALWDCNLKSGSLMLNSLHLKRSEDCNLNF
jgi:hypothetical protein